MDKRDNLLSLIKESGETGISFKEIMAKMGATKSAISSLLHASRKRGDPISKAASNGNYVIASGKGSPSSGGFKPGSLRAKIFDLISSHPAGISYDEVIKTLKISTKALQNGLWAAKHLGYKISNEGKMLKIDGKGEKDKVKRAYHRKAPNISSENIAEICFDKDKIAAYAEKMPQEWRGDFLKAVAQAVLYLHNIQAFIKAAEVTQS